MKKMGRPRKYRELCRVTVCMEKALADRASEAALKAGQSLSCWASRAFGEYLRSQEGA